MYVISKLKQLLSRDVCVESTIRYYRILLSRVTTRDNKLNRVGTFTTALPYTIIFELFRNKQNIIKQVFAWKLVKIYI